MEFAPNPDRAANRRSQPAYHYPEAARYLHISLSTLRSWFSGQAGFAPVIELSDPLVKALSFDNLVEAHVLAAIRRKHRIPLQRVRRALDFTKDHFGVDRPLIHQQFATNGVDLFVEGLGETVNASQGGQLAMQMRARLDRVDRDNHGFPIKLFPFTRTSEEPTDARIIVIDPQLAFGRPAIVHKGIPTDVIAQRYGAGESACDIAEDYGVDLSAIDEALRCELRLAA